MQQKLELVPTCKLMYPLADPGGTAGVWPPTGSNSFLFACVFAKKHPGQRLASPQQLSTPPQWEILDPPLVSIVSVLESKQFYPLKPLQIT